MALTFPLTLAQFVDLLPVASCRFDLGEALQTDETGGGEMLTSVLGARLWAGRYAMAPMTLDEATAAQGLIDLMRAPGAAFDATDLRQRGPRGDPAGTGLGGFAPVITATQSAGREITIGAAPPGYVLARGDLLAFGYGIGATRRALHRVVTGGTAGVGGTTGWIEVVPAVRAGWPAAAPVTLVRPTCKATLLPQSFEPGEWSNRLVTGLSFRFTQTLAG